MLRYNLSTVAILLLAFLVQQFIPAFTGLSNARFLVVHLVFLCCAVTVTPPTMLLLAFIGGSLWDAHCSLSQITGDPEIYTHPVESIRFGYSILLFGAAGYLMQGLSPLFSEGKWHFTAILTGIAVFLYLAAEFAIISFVRGDFVITRSVLRMIFYTSILTMLLSPLVFSILFKTAKYFEHTLYRKKGKSRYRSA